MGLDNFHCTKSHVAYSIPLPCGLNYQFLGQTTMPVVETTSTMTALLQVGSHFAQLLFYEAWERMTAEYPLEMNKTM